MRHHAPLATAALVAALALRACAASERLTVVTGIDPVAFVADRVGGPLVETRVLVGAGQDPHTYEPTPAQMTALAEGGLYLRIGLPFEDALLERVVGVSPRLTVVDAARGVPRRAPDEVDHGRERVDGDAGDGRDGPVAGAGAHDHNERTDPHVWMSPRLMKTIAVNVSDAFAAADPVHASDFRRRLATLLSDLDALDAEVAAALAPLRGRSLYVFHDAFGYFADAYGLRQVAIETGGREPGPRRVATIIEDARRDGVRAIFVQPQFSTVSAQAIASEIGGAVVPFDPLARDYIGSMRKAAGAVKAALEPRR
jgi:zinc transport system substrate-binding protein